MKISVSSYSFFKLFSDNFTQLDCIAKAKELGFDAIEFSEIHAPKGTNPIAYAQKLKAECDRVGIPVSSLTIGADLLKDTKAEIARLKKMVDIAEILGAPIMRHDATRGDRRPFDTILPILSYACKEITEYAASKGVKTTVENHGFLCQDSDRMEKLYASVSHPNFGLLIDMGNFLCADEAPEKAVGRLAEYAAFAHAKDFHVKSAMGPDPGEGFFRSRNGTFLRGAIIGHGDVPIKHCLAALKKAGYDGPVSIEFEGMEDPIKGISIGLANLRRYISEL